MIVVVSGSRTITDYRIVADAIERSLFVEITELWHGAQPGKYVDGVWMPTVDLLAALWSNKNHIPVRTFPADWNKHGKAAGPIRNSEMATEASRSSIGAGLVAVWDGTSHGTDDCVRKFSALKLPVFEYNRLEDCYNWYPHGKYK